MRRYGLDANLIQLKDNNQNKGETIYIDRRPKATREYFGVYKKYMTRNHK
jgi:hypothetical protein